MDTNTLITLIENLLIKRRTQPLVPQEISILDKYKKLIFELQEPLTLLENTKDNHLHFFLLKKLKNLKNGKKIFFKYFMQFWHFS